MRWLIGIGLTALVLWGIFWLWPRISAHWIDRRARLRVAMQFKENNPPREAESDAEYRRRIHWHILKTFAVPPLYVVRLWLKDGKPPILPPSDLLEEYLNTYEGQPLADGKPDPRISNGEGKQVLEIVQSMEAQGWGVGGTGAMEG